MSWLSRLQLGEGSDEAPGEKTKAKTSAQGNDVDAALAMQEVMVAPGWGGSVATILSIPPCCHAAGCDVAGEMRSRICREGVKKPQALMPKQVPREYGCLCLSLLFGKSTLKTSPGVFA